jgi:hypothetical protein
MTKISRSAFRFSTAALLGLSCTLAAAAVAVGDDRARVQFRDDGNGQLAVHIDGREAVVYRYGPNEDLVHYFPVRSPAGKPLTVQQTEPYPHHRSFWFADKVQLDGQRPVEFYGALYSNGRGPDQRKPPFRDRVRHVEFVSNTASGDKGHVISKLVWEMDFDRPVLDEMRDLKIVALADGEYLLDIRYTLTAAHGDVTFVSDAVHYAWPYLRMSPEFSVKQGGAITNSEGGKNQAGTNGKQARWVDYSGTVDGTTEGLAVFSHSDNEQPHQWLTRDYGTFGPRRVDAKSGKKFTLAKGDSISRRVGIYVHRGDVGQAKVAERYRQYVDGELQGRKDFGSRRDA